MLLTLNANRINPRFCLLLILILSLVMMSNSHLSYNPTHPYQWQVDMKLLPPPSIPDDNPMTKEGVQLGKLLFYDKLLSRNQTISCGSCHIQQYGFSDNRQFSKGVSGKALEVNTLPLINLAWKSYYFWDGRIKKLEDLIFEPILNENEMGHKEEQLLSLINKHKYYPQLFESVFGQKKITRDLIEKAIAQFLRSIVSNGIHLPEEVLNNPPLGMTEAEFYYQNNRDTTLRGFYFRFANMCGSCHQSEIYDDPEFMATNLVNDPKSLKKVPSLINISYTSPYMHDGRFKTLQEVLIHYNEHISDLHLYNNMRINERIKNQIVENYDIQKVDLFFEYFTDKNLLENDHWSNPFTSPNFNWEHLLNNNN